MIRRSSRPSRVVRVKSQIDVPHRVSSEAIRRAAGSRSQSSCTARGCARKFKRAVADDGVEETLKKIVTAA